MTITTGKEAHLDPLWVFRKELVLRRRKAALERDLAGTLKAQADLELIDRALADELKSAH